MESDFVSGRYMIVSRDRLVAALPITAELAWFKSTFEYVWSNAAKGRIGQMACDGQVLAKHPPPNEGRMNLPTMIESLSKSEGGRPGLNVLIERMEAGQFLAHAADNHCEDMLVKSADRIDGGYAWLDMSHDSNKTIR